MTVDVDRIRVIPPDDALPDDVADGVACYRAASDAEYHAARLRPGDRVTAGIDGTDVAATVTTVWFYDGIVVDVTCDDGTQRSLHPQFGDRVTPLGSCDA